MARTASCARRRASARIANTVYPAMRWRQPDMFNFGKGAVIDDAAIPLLIDGAGLSIGRVVNVESQRRHHNASQGKQGNEVSHRNR